MPIAVTGHGASANDALVTVAAQVLARHGPAGDLVGQGVGRILPTLPGLAVQAAKLAALGRVDAMQADTLAVHLNGIAVDDSGGAGHVGQDWRGEQAEGDGEGAHGYSVPWLGEKE